MYQINDSINNQGFNKLQVSKLNNGPAETLLITLEKNALFPEHTSPRDAHLIVLEGEIIFHINSEIFHLKKHQDFKFPKETPHWVEAVENSKFLIIR
jgi:quercetin dioxygenase-like cupin family protein